MIGLTTRLCGSRALSINHFKRMPRAFRRPRLFKFDDKRLNFGRDIGNDDNYGNYDDDDDSDDEDKDEDETECA